MGKVILKSAITRKPGYMYYLDGKGNVLEAKMNRKGGKKGRTVCATAGKKTKAKAKKKVAKKVAKKRK